MKITKIETIPLSEAPFPEPISPAWAPGYIWTGMAFGIIKIHTDEGLVGIGAGSVTSLERVRKHVVPALLGQDPLMIEEHVKLLERVGGVWMVELALWDLLGKAAGLPLYQLWGGYTDRVRAYASLTEMGTPDQRTEDALRLAEEGFRAVKLRAHNESPYADLALVQAVREAVGDRMEIMVDANQANVIPGAEVGPVWDLRRAIWTAKAFEDLQVTWLEEPLSRYDFAAIATLCATVRLPIAGGENNRDIRDFVQMAALDAYDIYQPDVMVAGIANCRRVAGLAQAAGKLSLGHHGGTGLGMVARLHLNAACPNAPWVEYFYDPYKFVPEVFQGMIAEPLRIDAEGYLQAPQRPGLGVELDEAFIQRYRV